MSECPGLGYRAFSVTWSASMLIYWNKRNHFHEKRVKLPGDFLGTPAWPPFHYFGTPIWPPWRHVKTLYYWSCHVGKIHIYLILKIKNAIWEIKDNKLWKSTIRWKIKMKHWKKMFFFSRQNIKIKENNTRIKTSCNSKWYSSSTVDIKLGRRYLVKIL